MGILHVFPELLHVTELLLAHSGLQVTREFSLVNSHFHQMLRTKVPVEARLRRVGNVALLTFESGINHLMNHLTREKKGTECHPPHFSCFAVAFALGPK